MVSRRALRIFLFLLLTPVPCANVVVAEDADKEKAKEEKQQPPGEVTGLPEMVVTEQPEQSYAVKSATTATKTDTPIMETPVSIQVIPQQVIQDQQATRLDQAVKNVSGVYTSRCRVSRHR